MNKFESQRAKLRRFTLDDEEHMRLLESDPEIMRYTPSKVPQTAEQTKEKLATLVATQKVDDKFGIWAAEEKSTRNFIGWFMLREGDLPHPELGFMIIKDQWGKGFATEISEAIVQYGMVDLNLSGISARTTVDNVRSIRVLEKVGFKFTSTIQVPDKITSVMIDLKVFELKPF
ncbi:MAG: GNAT family N-acetyltransferase [Bdellovibrionota bacterium]